MKKRTIRIKRTNWPVHQIKWWDLPNFIKALIGGFGCGKTYIGSLKAIYLSYLHRGLFPGGMYVSPTYTMAEMTVIPTIQDLFHKMQIQYKYVGSPKNMFHVPLWDGHFKIASGDNPNSLKGPNLAWVGIDEPFIQKKMVFDEAQRRIRPVRKDSEIFLTGTPEELNWGYDVCTNSEGKYDIGVVYGKTIDNKFAGEDYYNMLWNAYSEEERQAYLEGKFLNLLHGRVYKEFDRSRHIIHLDYHPSFRLCAGIDFNVDYMTAEIFWDMKTGVHFIDEIRLANSNTFELAEKLKAKYPGIYVYPDPTGSARKSSSTRTDHQILREHGFVVLSKAYVPVRDRVNSANSLLRKDKFSIEPNKCPHLVRDLERNIWKSGDMDKSEAELTHAGDAAGYSVEYLYPIRKYGGGITARA